VNVLYEQTPFVNRETGGYAQASEPQSEREELLIKIQKRFLVFIIPLEEKIISITPESYSQKLIAC